MYTFLSQFNNKESLKIYSSTMMAMSHYINPRLVTGVDYDRFLTLADFGGNSGVFLAQILQNHPKIQHGIIFDLPHVIDKSGRTEKSLNHLIYLKIGKHLLLVTSMTHQQNHKQMPICLNIFYIIIVTKNVSSFCCRSKRANQDHSRLLVTIFIVEHVIFYW